MHIKICLYIYIYIYIVISISVLYIYIYIYIYIITATSLTCILGPKAFTTDLDFLLKNNIGIVVCLESDWDGQGKTREFKLPPCYKGEWIQCVLTNPESRIEQLPGMYTAVIKAAYHARNAYFHCEHARHRGPMGPKAVALLDGSRLPAKEIMEYIAMMRDPYKKGWVWAGHYLDRREFEKSWVSAGRVMDSRDDNLFKTKNWIDNEMLKDKRLKADTFAPIRWNERESVPKAAAPSQRFGKEGAYDLGDRQPSAKVLAAVERLEATKEVVALRQYVSKLKDQIFNLEMEVSFSADSVEKYAEETSYGPAPECYTKFVGGLLLLHVLCKEARENPRCGALVWDLCEAMAPEDSSLIDAYSLLDRDASAPSLHDLTPMHIICSAGRSYPSRTHEDILVALLSFGHSVTKPDCGYRRSNCLQVAACSMFTDNLKFFLNEALELKAVNLSELRNMRHPLNGASLAKLASQSNRANKNLLMEYGVPLAEEDYTGRPINSYVPLHLQRQREAGLNPARFERMSSFQQSQKGDRGSQPGKGRGSGKGGGGGGGGKKATTMKSSQTTKFKKSWRVRNLRKHRESQLRLGKARLENEAV